MKKHIVTISGPSLTGKTTLENYLKKEGFEAVVSTTTRVRRAGEVDGEHYHFIDKKEFLDRLNNSAFVEHVEVDGNFYGVAKLDVEKALSKSGKVAIVCEPHGAKQVYEYAKKEDLDITRVFINNPRSTLFARFLERFKEDSNATIERYVSRLNNMIDFEEQKWIKPAIDGIDSYEILFDSFDSKNEKSLIDLIKMHVSERDVGLKKNKIK